MFFSQSNTLWTILVLPFPDTWQFIPQLVHNFVHLFVLFVLLWLAKCMWFVTLCSMCHLTIRKSSARLNGGSPPLFGSTPCGVLPLGEPYIRGFLPPLSLNIYSSYIHPLCCTLGGREPQTGELNRWVTNTWLVMIYILTADWLWENYQYHSDTD